MAMECFIRHMRHIALLVLFIIVCDCEWPPPTSHHQTDGHTSPSQQWSIASMAYSFGFPLSCDVNVDQTITVNYTRGNFSEGKLFIPVNDYDRLEFKRITDGEGADIQFDVESRDGSFYRVVYNFDPLVAPCLKTYKFQYPYVSSPPLPPSSLPPLIHSLTTPVQATKTFSRSGSSKNSFSWRTITKEFQSSIAVFNVVLNFAFHTQEDSIDCNPEYSSVELGDKSTIVFFATQTNIPEDSELTHEISFPKRVTCKPASTYKLVAVGVVLGSIIFAFVSTMAAVVVRRMKQRRREQFEQLAET